MTETTENNDEKKKRLGLSRPAKLELKKTVASGQVRQSFSHGRSKMVTVEVRRKRTYAPDSGGRMAKVERSAQPDELDQAGAEGGLPGGAAARAALGASLTDEEKAARARALEDAHKQFGGAGTAAGVAEQAGEEPPAGTLEDERQRQAELEEARQREEAEAQRRQELAKASASAAAAKLQAHEEAERTQVKKPRVPLRRQALKDELQAGLARRGEPRRRASAKISIDEALGVREERMRSLASVRRAREKQKQQFMGKDQAKKILREVVLPETITVQELANRMAERSQDVIRTLMKMDVMVSASDIIDADTAELVIAEFGHSVRRVSDSDVELGLTGPEDDVASLKPRPPVVTVMGHVDHGKTSLLDALRKTEVAAGEAGGITQHIGAYQVSTPSGAKITFIDTPGHAAFTDMRARGARVTDIVVLVVAADDSVMPQTIEAIDHAKAAGVPIIVAINKMDLPNADANRVRTELLQHDVVVEELGGDVLSVEISAKKKMNLDKLQEAILLQAELMDLRANPDRPAEGVVIEAEVKPGRGSVATVLVQRGTLRTGDVFVAGVEWGRVRALMDPTGKPVTEAGPGVPVEVLGLNGTPAAGDDFVVVDDEARAREVSEFRQRRQRRLKAAAASRGTLEQMFERIQQGEARELAVVVKADVHGSLEAVQSTLAKMGTDEVKVNVLHAAVGGINESDVALANASGALVIGFNVRANAQARALAKSTGVDIRYYSIIYELADDMRNMLSGLLSPQIKETVLGYAEVLEVFSVSKVGKIAGCRVTEGMVRRGAKVRLVRDDTVIHEGSLAQLKRFKEDVKEVKEGTECGIAFENYQDIQVGDIIECFEVEEIARQL